MTVKKTIFSRIVFVVILGVTTIGGQSAVAQSKVKCASTMSYIEIDSPSLELVEKIDVGVYLPANYETIKDRLPVVYFLHGVNQNETSWEKMGIKDILDDLIDREIVLPMIVVAPGSKEANWVNWISGKNQWENFITIDLVKAIDKKYRTAQMPSMRGISGASAGGIGALILGFTYFETFGSITSHSAAVQPENPAELPDWAKDWEGWEERVGKPIDVEFWKKQNVLYLARTLKKEQLEKQAIYFDVGEKDHLGFAEPNVLLSEILSKRGIPHTFVLRSGGHGSKFVKDNAHFALKFHSQVFKESYKEKR